MPLDPVPQWPGTGLDALPDPTTAQYEDDDGFEIDLLLQKHNAILEAVEAKLGSTVTGTPTRGKALIGKGTDAGVWDVVGRKNVLLNGDFRVLQLGAIGAADNSSIHDGWRVLMEAASACVVTQETADAPTDGGKFGCKLTVGSGEDNKFGIWQVLPYADCSDLRGKTVSLQCKLKATAAITDVRMAVVEFTGTADSGVGGVDPISVWGSAGTNPTLAANFAYLGTPANLSPTTSWATYRVENIAVGASMNNLGVLIWCEDETTTVTTDILRIADVQLEEGAVCTNVERRPFAYDLAWARSRWQQSYGYGVAVSTTDAGSHYVLASDNIATKYAAVEVRFGIPMRATPTITLYDRAGASGKISTLAVAGTVTNNVTPSAGTFGTTSDGFFVLHSGGIAGVQYHWTADARM